MIEGIEQPGGPESIRDLDAASWNPREILGDIDLEQLALDSGIQCITRLIQQLCELSIRNVHTRHLLVGYVLFLYFHAAS